MAWEAEEGRGSADTVLVTPEPRRRPCQGACGSHRPRGTARTCRGGVKRGGFHGQLSCTWRKGGDVPAALFSRPEPGAMAPPGPRQSTALGGAPFYLMSSSFLQFPPLYQSLICSSTVHLILEGLQPSDRRPFKPPMVVPTPVLCLRPVLLHVLSPDCEFVCTHGWWWWGFS